METATLDLPVVSDTVTVSPTDQPTASQSYAWLKPYQFGPGNNANPHGRPVGSKNRITPQALFKRRELGMTYQYCKRAMKSDAVLIDAMKRILPVNDDTQRSPMQVVVFVGDGTLPRAVEAVPLVLEQRVDESANQELVNV
jgi:hypothetical protein